MTVLFSCAPQFGQNPEGAALARISASPNYAGGKFRNQSDTPMFANDTTFLSALLGGIFSSSDRNRPDHPLPAIKTELKALDPAINAVVWLGHSSYFIILNSKKILVDPVLAGYAAPFPIFNRAFEGTTIYSAADIPDVDYLLITHDHWDHLEYPTVTELMPRIGKVICPLGVGSHFRSWGFPAAKIEEKDWHEKFEADGGLAIHLVPARHFSGRGLTRDKTLWTGYALTSPDFKIFISGDSGYDAHFAEAGNRFEGFDLAIIEDGQYDERWPYIHMTPEESARAASELAAKKVMPCHNGRFCMARHAWDEPLNRFAKASGDYDYEVLLPEIGEVVFLE